MYIYLTPYIGVNKVGHCLLQHIAIIIVHIELSRGPMGKRDRDCHSFHLTAKYPPNMELSLHQAFDDCNGLAEGLGGKRANEGICG